MCGVGTEVLIDVAGSGERHVELGLGASYLGGVNVKIPGMDFHGAVRSFPTVSAYYTALPIWKNWEWYGGASVGLAELSNAQTHDTEGVEREVKGNTFEYGLIGGVYTELKGVGLFAEGSYRWRRFRSLDYTLVDADSGRLPTSWPRELDFSGPSVAVGLQFRLKKDEPAASTQVWALAEVDARKLPAPVATTAPGNAAIVFGSLTLTSTKKDSSYVLQVVSRSAVLNADGTVQALSGTPDVRTETGKFRVTSGSWTLDENGPDQAPAAYPITRLGDDFVIRDSATGAMLTFRKAGVAPPAAAADAKKE